MGMTVTIDGPLLHDSKHRAMAELSEIRDNLEDSVRAELDAVCQKILAAAIELCPKDTGALASSITMEHQVSEGDFYHVELHAGSPDIVNPVTHIPTSNYAMLVHEGHLMRNGEMWEGIPFLAEAVLMYEGELELACSRAISECGKTEPSASKVSEMESVS